MSAPPVGLLLIDKPSGPTSHDVVVRVRRATGQRRAGHAGTLDPQASGLLPVALGPVTRLIRFLPHSPKHYEGTLQLGLTTRTDDLDGELLARHDGSLPGNAQVLEAAQTLLGRQLQVPPDVSARKVGGERLYRLARRGERVEAPAAQVEVQRFELRAAAEPGRYDFVAEVSSGTYVRALARDLGARLGCGGVLAALRRVRIGSLGLDRAVELPPPDTEGWHPDELIPPEAMPLEPPDLTLHDAASAERFRHGGLVELPPGGQEGEHRVLAPDGRLLGVGDRRGGRLQPRVVLPPGGPG